MSLCGSRPRDPLSRPGHTAERHPLSATEMAGMSPSQGQISKEEGPQSSLREEAGAWLGETPE